MTDRGKGGDGEPMEDDRILVEDTGESLDAALAEEERSAIAAAEDKLHGVERDLENLKDRHLRTLAEFENLRKRNEREKKDTRSLALADLAREFLPVLDSFESALAHATADDLESDLGQGVLLIHRQLSDLWRKRGLREVDTIGTFDPNEHEAVATEASTKPANTILEVLRKGYTLGDRLIRPALVKVAVKPGENASPGDARQGS
ncbi:MAG TPA: nucleotide exchange factor GrpE [Thermoanaerobaculia bacterium]|jgi:molecular chaperone GrpE|nr:nucleotide exchange factor GrpE [Thermoanaerobaculia bacterium]